MVYVNLHNTNGSTVMNNQHFDHSRTRHSNHVSKGALRWSGFCISVVFCLVGCASRGTEGPISVSAAAQIEISSTARGPAIDNSIPLSAKEATLPHSGLLIRRNPHYGTNHTITLSELISSGVQIDQIGITFDDFVNNALVPKKDVLNDLQVDYGIANKSSSGIGNDKCYLEIALQCRSSVPGAKQLDHVVPLNCVFAVDLSGSMSGAKIDMAKAAAMKLYERLAADDIVGIIGFETTARTILTARRKGDRPLKEFAGALTDLVGDGGTDINMGIEYAIAEILRHDEMEQMNCIILLSDGNPTSGETKWLNIRKNIVQKTRGAIGVYCFALGSDANVKEFNTLSGATGGFATFVAGMNDLEVNIEREINRRVRISALNIKVKVRIDPSVSILRVFGHDLITEPRVREAIVTSSERAAIASAAELGIKDTLDFLRDEDGLMLFVPNLRRDDLYVIMFELANCKQQLESLGLASVEYIGVTKRERERIDVNLKRQNGIDSSVVMEHALSLTTSEVVFYALDDLYEGDIRTASTRIGAHIETLSLDPAAKGSRAVNDTVVTLRKLLSISENLGKPAVVSDSNRTSVEGALRHSLYQFGRVKGGFVTPSTD